MYAYARVRRYTLAAESRRHPELCAPNKRYIKKSIDIAARSQIRAHTHKPSRCRRRTPLDEDVWHTPC